MPKPEGWTDADLKKRDKLADKLQKEKRLKKSNSFALATWIVNHNRG